MAMPVVRRLLSDKALTELMNSLWEAVWACVAKVEPRLLADAQVSCPLSREDTLMIQMALMRLQLGCNSFVLRDPRSVLSDWMQEHIENEWIRRERLRLSRGTQRLRVANDIARVLGTMEDTPCHVRHHFNCPLHPELADSPSVLVVGDIAVFRKGTPSSEMDTARPSQCIMIVSDFHCLLRV